MMRLSRLLPVWFVLCVGCRVLAQESATLAVPYDPTQHWEVDYESGIIWRFTGSATPLSYTVLPQLLTIKSPLVGTIRPFFGGDLVIRNRFSLLGEPIIVGPEHHFMGGSASGIIEWWDKRRTRSLFFSSGGGIGWLDSKGHEIKGAQGEDFNLNWFAYAGARIFLRSRLSASAGVYFQHISNRYMNPVNPGLNAVGPMLSLGWHF
ncbi:MAG: acyloxyacyl hydrolase [Opitutaceae bacterium]